MDRYGPVALSGNAVSCGVCREVVYDNARAIVNHDFTMLPDGRAKWFSRDFGLVIHLCDEKYGVVAEAERALFSAG